MLHSVARSATLLALACGAACVPAARGSTQGPPHAVAGTYRLSICEGDCAADRSNLLATGTLVLASGTFGLDRLSEAGQRHLRQSNPWLLAALRESDTDPNACFALASHPGATSLAGDTPAGVTGWRSGENGIAVLLWTSPDAGYAAELRPAGRDLVGSGFTWGMPDGYRQTRETITAAYAGPPDLDGCLRMIENEAARVTTPN